MNIKKLKFTWKHRQFLWKYRRLLRHRKEIAACALGSMAVAAGIFVAKRRIES